MKALYFLLLITFCESTLVGLSPTNVRLTTYGDDKESWFVVSWTKVINSDATDPVLGYKVKIWILRPIKTIVYTSDSEGNMVATQREYLLELDNNKDASDEVTIIDVPADKTEATYRAMRKEITYEVGVLAYTAKAEGKISKKMRVKLGS